MCFILHIFDCDEREWCELECVNWVGANRLRPVFIFGKYFCVEFDCAEFDLGEFIWCESVIWANVIWANAIRPLRGI